MKAAIRDAQQHFPELSESELVALTLWKLRYVLMRDGHAAAEATTLARLTFERQFADVAEESPATAEPPSAPSKPRARRALAVTAALIAAFLGMVFAAPGRS